MVTPSSLFRPDRPHLQGLAQALAVDASAAEHCRRDIATADFIVLTQLFQEEQVQATFWSGDQLLADHHLFAHAFFRSETFGYSGNYSSYVYARIYAEL